MTCTRVVIEVEEKDAVEVRVRKWLITGYIDFEGRRIQNLRFGDDSNFLGSVDGVW